MLNVCFLLGSFQINGGIGRVTSILANELSRKEDYKITTISYCKMDAPMLYNLSNNIKHYGLLSNNISMSKALIKKHIIKKTKDIIKNEKIDILIACGALFFPLGILSVKGTKAKCFCWEHTSPNVTLDYRFQGLCRKFGVKFANRLVVITKQSEEYFISKFKVKKERIHHIYNPIPKKDFDVTYNDKSKKIISVGRLSTQKNFFHLVDIAAQILPNHPDWSWDIYGGGELHDDLQMYISEKALNGRLNLKGQVYNITNYYSDYAFLVMTSKYEGFPMCLLEGINYGLPLVSYDILTGPREIIKNNENGFLIPAFESEVMKQAITELIVSDEKRKAFSKNAFNTIDEFSLDNIIEQWDRLFLDCK